MIEFDSNESAKTLKKYNILNLKLSYLKVFGVKHLITFTT